MQNVYSKGNLFYRGIHIMPDNIKFISASSLSLEAFATLFNRSFENYLYPITLTAANFATRIRTEQLDLHHSVVLTLNDRPIGQATLGVRGDKAWCGGFGIVPEQRGKRFAAPLFDEFIKRAREAGAKRLSLEVLEKNVAAQKLYAKAGMQHQRDLRLLEWKRDLNQAKQKTSNSEMIQTANIPEVVLNFYRLHPAASAWQRDLPSLILQRDLSQLHYREGGNLRGYVLFIPKNDSVRIYDLGAEDLEIAKRLLTSLQVRYKEIYSVNEPSDSSITAAYDACNFREYDCQYELAVTL
jgi:RimJ/RimL family protein N-acetyltransferase